MNLCSHAFVHDLTGKWQVLIDCSFKVFAATLFACDNDMKR